MSVPYPPAKISFHTTRKYLSSNLAAGHHLGNNIFELAALYGLSKRLGRIPLFFIEDDFHLRMKGYVENVMPGLMAQFLVVNGSVPGKIRRTKFHQKCCTFDNPKRLEKIEDEYLHLTGELNMFIAVFTILLFLGTFATVVLLVYDYYENTKFDPMAVPHPPAEILFQTGKKYLSSELFAGYQLGNNIFELAALYGLSKRLGRIPLFFIENDYYPRMKDKVEKAMPGLMAQFLVVNGSVPGNIRRTKFHQKCCTFDNPKRLEKIEDEYLHLTGELYQSWKYFHDMRDTLRDFLAFPDFGKFKNLPQSDENTHVTCIHTRRSDFIEKRFYSSDPVFIRNAVTYLNEESENDKTKSRKFVIFGDDQQFMKSIFNGNSQKSQTDYFVSENEPSDDLIYSKYNCDRVLISAPRSTFGFWMGYLSKGNAVYHMDITHENKEFYRSRSFNSNDFFPIPRITLDFASSENKTVVER